MGAKEVIGMIGDVAGAATGLGGVFNMVEGLFGGGNEEKKQLEQQKELQKIQKEDNKELAEHSAALQQNMYDYTFAKNTEKAKLARIKEAGLSPELMYSGGMSGGGGATTGSASAGQVSGGQAATAAAKEAARIQKTMMGLEMQKLGAEVKVLEADAKQKEADAENKGADTETKDAIRTVLVEQTRQGAIGEFIRNVQERHKMEGFDPDAHITQYNNPIIGLGIKMEKEGAFAKGVETQITQMLAEVSNINANTLLTNEKAKGYVTELINDTIEAKAMEDFGKASLSQAETARLNELNNRIIANAQKLNSEYLTGEKANWKNVTETISGAVGAVAGGVANIVTRGVAGGAKTILKGNPVKGFGK